MTEREVGIRQLKTHLSRYLRRVKAGETLVVTEHGRPIGRILPTGRPLEQRIQDAMDAGILEWDGRPWHREGPSVPLHGERSVSDLIVEDRE